MAAAPELAPVPPLADAIAERPRLEGTVTLETIASPSALDSAWARVRAKRSGPGLDAISVDAFDRNAAGSLAILRDELLSESYLPAPLRRVSIPKPSHPGEQRALGLPSVRDKIAQESVRAALEPLAERLFLDSSYGYRPAKGPARAISRIRHHLASLKHTWAARVDIDNCFGSLPIEGVLQAASTLGADTGVRRLLELWLRMGALDWRGRWHDADGIPQGAVVSPLLANLYLHALDVAMRACPEGDGYVRYADDLIVTAKSAAACLLARERIADTLVTLRLRLNVPLADPVPAASGFEFLGIAFSAEGLAVAPGRVERGRQTLAREAARAAEHPADAARRIGETVEGWRRYYGALVAPDGLTGLDAVAAGGWVALLRAAQQPPTSLPRSAATPLVAAADGVLARDWKQRKAWVEAIIRQAWSKEPRRSHAGEPADASVRRTPALRRTSRPTPAPSLVPTAPPVEGRAHESRASAVRSARPVRTVVRQQKRATLRSTAVQAELIVNTPGAFVGKRGDRLIVRLKQQILAEASIHRLHAVTLAAEGVGVSSDVLTMCTEHDVPVVFTGAREQVHALVLRPDGAPARIAMLQAETLADPARGLDLAKRFVLGKLRNQANLLKYLGKYRRRRNLGASAALATGISALEKARGEALAVPGSSETATGQLFSAEGRGATGYWQGLAAVLPAAVAFPGRQHQGATDLANSLLNYGYAVLKSRVFLALTKAGLNPGISFLHSTHRRDATLVYDLVEEFRAPVVDRVVVTLLGRREITAVGADGRLTLEARKRLLMRLHARLATLVRFRGRDLTLGDVIDQQARAIVRHLEGTARYRAYAAPW